MPNLVDTEREHAFKARPTCAARCRRWPTMSVALENAPCSTRPSACSRRPSSANAELAVINSIQQGIAGSLDFQGIVDLVGDTLRARFHTGDLGIN